MEFQLQPLFLIHDSGGQHSIPTVRFACELPVFEPGYNFEFDGTSTISASTEWQAVLQFLNQYDSAHTVRSYCAEIEKFLLWLLLVKKLPLSGLKRDDWNDYIEYLQNIPLEHSGARCNRFTDEGVPNPAWRPFVRSTEPLAEKSVNKAVKIIEALFRYLVDAGFLKASPVIGRRKRSVTASERAIEVSERFLPMELLDLTIDHLHSVAQNIAHDEDLKTEYKKLMRAKFIIQFLRDTGLRAEELVNAKMGDFKIEKRKWILKVIGKGRKARHIAIQARLRETIMEYRVINGLPPYPTINEETPLFSSLLEVRPMTTRRLRQVVGESFSLVADGLRREAERLNPASHRYGELIRQSSILSVASPHWLRHSHATEYLRETGNNTFATMQRLGHSNMNTTSLYVHLDSDEDGF
jgi:site-specific recombinase XerD